MKLNQITKSKGKDLEAKTSIDKYKKTLIAHLRQSHFLPRYFLRGPQQVFKRQVGAFRTNCIDCLDRTNVVQTMLARITLQQQVGRKKLQTQEYEE